MTETDGYWYVGVGQEPTAGTVHRHGLVGGGELGELSLGVDVALDQVDPVGVVDVEPGAREPPVQRRV